MGYKYNFQIVHFHVSLYLLPSVLIKSFPNKRGITLFLHSNTPNPLLCGIFLKREKRGKKFSGKMVEPYILHKILGFPTKVEFGIKHLKTHFPLKKNMLDCKNAVFFNSYLGPQRGKQCPLFSIFLLQGKGLIVFIILTFLFKRGLGWILERGF